LKPVLQGSFLSTFRQGVEEGGAHLWVGVEPHVLEQADQCSGPEEVLARQTGSVYKLDVTGVNLGPGKRPPHGLYS
jgi:hypothetical protein